MRSRIKTIIRVLSIPIFILTLASAVRTLSIQTNDLFHFGRGDRWWCYLIINFWNLSGSLEVYEPGHAPRSGWGTGPFFDHVVAIGGTWTLSDTTYDSYVTHDWIIVGSEKCTFGGATVSRQYWIHLPFLLPVALLLSSIILWLWTRQFLVKRAALRKGLCPKCSYDLRAHRPGDKCPECGTQIPG